MNTSEFLRNLVGRTVMLIDILLAIGGFFLGCMLWGSGEGHWLLGSAWLATCVWVTLSAMDLCKRP